MSRPFEAISRILILFLSLLFTHWGKVGCYRSLSCGAVVLIEDHCLSFRSGGREEYGYLGRRADNSSRTYDICDEHESRVSFVASLWDR